MSSNYQMKIKSQVFISFKERTNLININVVKNNILNALTVNQNINSKSILLLIISKQKTLYFLIYVLTVKTK